MSTDQSGHKPAGGNQSGSSPTPARTSDDKSTEGAFTRFLVRIATLARFGTTAAPMQVAASSDVGTALAQERTGLAIDRSYLAAERTLMAWIRTALSMISFGFTIGKIGQILSDVTIKGVMGRSHNVSIQELAFLLVILGTLALLGASLQHWHRIRELRSLGLGRELSITFWVALLLTAIGGFALTALSLSL